jgi:AraC family transcriptional activator of pobA
MLSLEAVMTPPNRHPIVARVIEFIEANYADGISLADVARAFNYSPSHLTSLVRRETGRPVTAWIIERRMLAARERLVATDEPVATVAEAVGFRDVAYFARRFTRANGTTPARWRTRYLHRPEAHRSCPTCGSHVFLEAAG